MMDNCESLGLPREWTTFAHRYPQRIDPYGCSNKFELKGGGVKSLHLIVLFIMSILMSKSAMAGWVSELSTQANTGETVGHVTLVLTDSALSVGCPEGAGLIISFYSTHRFGPNIQMDIDVVSVRVMSPVTAWYEPDNAIYPAFPTGSRTLIRKIIQANQITVTVSRIDGSMTSTVTYDVWGFLQRFQSVCNWHPGYAAVVP